MLWNSSNNNKKIHATLLIWSTAGRWSSYSTATKVQLRRSFLPTNCYKMQNSSVEAVPVWKEIIASTRLNLEIHTPDLLIRATSWIPVTASVHACVSVTRICITLHPQTATDIQSVHNKLYYLGRSSFKPKKYSKAPQIRSQHNFTIRNFHWQREWDPVFPYSRK